MIKTIRTIMQVFLVGALVAVTGCGGGGGSAPVATTKIAGTASKGILFPGSVSIYALDAAGTKATTALATVATVAGGFFTADIGAYTGAVAIEATGTYTDEATLAPVTISPARPMRAALDAVSPATTKRFAVTPLTDLAYSLAGTLTPANIAAANARVSSLFKLADITGIEPVQASVAAMTDVGTDRQAYTLALAAISQMAHANNPTTAAAFSQIESILTSLLNDLNASATASFGISNRNQFSSALGVVSSGTLSGFTSATASLASVGTNTLKLTLTSSGIPSGTLIGGITGTISLPAGTSIRLAPAGTVEVLAGLFRFTGAGVTNVLIPTNYSNSTFTFAIATTSGFAQGDFATLEVDVSSGTPTAASFTITPTKIADATNNAAAIPGATLSLK